MCRVRDWQAVGRARHRRHSADREGSGTGAVHVSNAPCEAWGAYFELLLELPLQFEISYLGRPPCLRICGRYGGERGGIFIVLFV